MLRRGERGARRAAHHRSFFPTESAVDAAAKDRDAEAGTHDLDQVGGGQLRLFALCRKQCLDHLVAELVGPAWTRPVRQQSRQPARLVGALRLIKRNRRPALTRFMSREEVVRLHRALDAQTGESERQQADIIRLLLLTGCRRNEIVHLRWSEVRHNALTLADSKTGSRRVPLNIQARSILERRPRGASPFVFPSPSEPSRPRNPDFRLWRLVRRETDIEDVRLHNLRHTCASISSNQRLLLYFFSFNLIPSQNTPRDRHSIEIPV